MRLAISVGGIAFAVTLILLIRGLFVAYQTRVEDYYGSIDTDLWVLQSGTADFFHSFSLLPTDLETALEDLPGVAETEPYVARLVGLEVNGSDTVLYLVGYEPGETAAGPQSIAAGTDEIGPDEIVVDRVFAKQHGVDLGDELVLEGTTLRVAGFSTGGDLVMFQYAFADMDTTRQILDFEQIDNAVLLTLEDEADRATVSAAVEAADPNLMVRTPEAVIKTNQRVLNDGLLPVIRVLMVLGFIVGIAVVGLTIYSSVIERRREYGVLKALGARPGHLLSVIAVQSLLAAALGYAAGVMLAVAARWASERWVPQFITELPRSDLLWVAGATALMALVAATLPLLRVSRIDPGEVFRA